MSNLNYNKIILAGRLIADVEMRNSQNNTAVSTFSMAVSRYTGKEKTSDFFNCVAFGKMAEFISKYFHKGSSILVDGELQLNSYTDKDGEKRHLYKVKVNNAYFVDSANSTDKSTNETSLSTKPTNKPAKIETVNDEDDELPF